MQSIAYDTDGNGTNDVVNPVAGTEVSTLAQQPGLYNARLTVTDSNNVTYTAYRRYLVQDFAQHTGQLCDVYGYMKQRLTAQGGADIPGTLLAIHAADRDKYQSLFNSFGSDLSPFAATLGTITNGTFDGTLGNFLILRPTANNSLSGYRIQLSQDADGVWRVSDM